MQNHFFKSGYLVLCLLGLASFLIAACDEKGSVNGASKESVIATINGEPVLKSDLEALKKRMLGKVPETFIDETVENKLLDSLIQSKAMAQLMEKQLDKKDELAIDAKVRAFREDLLVRAYIDKYSASAQITNEQVKQYYSDNPQLFGGGFKKSVEYIEAGNVDDRDQRINLLTELTNLKTVKDWKAGIKRLEAKGFKLDYKDMTVNEQHLKSPIKEAVIKLNKESSPQLISEFGIFLVRVNDVQKIPPKPLAQVSSDIRSLLQRQAYRKSVETLTEKVMSQVKVEVINRTNVD